MYNNILLWKRKWFASIMLDTEEISHDRKASVGFVDRFYPSSKTCHACGHIKKTLKLSERIFNCEICGHKENRDLNAAKNIRDNAIMA